MWNHAEGYNSKIRHPEKRRKGQGEVLFVVHPNSYGQDTDVDVAREVRDAIRMEMRRAEGRKHALALTCEESMFVGRRVV